MKQFLDHPERFWSKVNKTEGCWLWTASTNKNGYGRYGNASTHRVAYELCIGPIPAGFEVDHVKSRGCTNRHCVNPAHLEVVTKLENIRRGGFAAKTHCPQGHPYNEENTYLTIERRHRMCRVCHNKNMQIRRAAQKIISEV